MANIVIRDGNDEPITVASDLIGGVEYPRSKMTHGAAGASTDVSAANPLPATFTGSGVKVGEVAVVFPTGTIAAGAADVVVTIAAPSGLQQQRDYGGADYATGDADRQRGLLTVRTVGPGV